MRSDAGVRRTVDRVAEARNLAALVANALHQGKRRGLWALPGGNPALGRQQQPAARVGRSDQHRAAAEETGRQRAVQRIRIGRERHPRRLDGRHHAVLGDGDQQKIEEEPLVLGRLAAGQEQMEIGGEAEATHEIAAQILAAHLDAVRPGGADSGDGLDGGLGMHRGKARPGRTRTVVQFPLAHQNRAGTCPLQVLLPLEATFMVARPPLGTTTSRLTLPCLKARRKRS